MVTSKGVGLSVPDWPTTFGYNMFFFPVSKWVGGVFFEHTHRLIASTVGFPHHHSRRSGWPSRTSPAGSRKLGWASLGMVILQGVLGGLRVTLMKAQIGIFHACVAQAFFAMLVVIALALSPVWQRLHIASARQNLRSLAAPPSLSPCIIYAQLALGATMRHQHRDLSITDFPLAYGQVIPKTESARRSRGSIRLEIASRSRTSLPGRSGCNWCIASAHSSSFRFSAFGFSLGKWRSCRPPPPFDLLAGPMCPMSDCVGGWTIWSNKAADIATAHVAVGAITFVTGVAISALIALRLRISFAGAALSPAAIPNLAEAKSRHENSVDRSTRPSAGAQPRRWRISRNW